MTNGVEITIRLSPEEVRALKVFDQDLKKAIHKLIKRSTRKPKDPLVAQAYSYILQYVPEEGITEEHFIGILKEWVRNKVNEMVASGALKTKPTEEEIANIWSKILQKLKNEGFLKLEIKTGPTGKERIYKLGDFSLEMLAGMVETRRMLSF